MGHAPLNAPIWGNDSAVGEGMMNFSHLNASLIPVVRARTGGVRLSEPALYQEIALLPLSA